MAEGLLFNPANAEIYKAQRLISAFKPATRPRICACRAGRRDGFFGGKVAAQAHFHVAFRQPFADHDFDGNAQQIGVFEFDAGALVPVIQQNVYPATCRS